MGATLQHLLGKFDEFKTLPAGKTFSIKVSDQEATAAANEYLTENREQVRKLLQEKTGMALDVDSPSIGCRDNGILLSAMGGIGFLKAKASLNADVQWNGKPSVTVLSVQVPVVSVTPEKLNSVVENPLKQLTKKVEEYAEILSFKLQNGFAELEAVKK